ncbi:MAG: peptide deformylase [Bacilli bacterium]
MLLMKDIIDEKDKRLRQVSKEVTFPMDKKDKENIKEMIEFLTNSQIPELSEKYDLRPGMGLAAVQIGVLKRYLVIVHEIEEGKFDNYVVVNPKIVSNSMEQIYVDGCEGCLSVNRDVEGIVPRYARVTIEGYDTEGNKIRIRAREELAVAFQHEIDHLNGIMFTDHIDKKNPFKNQDQYRAI